MDVWDDYTKQVMDHYENPRNVGLVENANGVGVVGNPACGDVIRVAIQVENELIKDAKFKTFGCGAAIATCSMVTEMIIGKSLDEARVITNSMIVDALGGLPKAKWHCSILANDAVKAAIADYVSNHNNSDQV